MRLSLQTHAIFSEEAPELLQESSIDRVYVTDSVLFLKKNTSQVTYFICSEMVAENLNIKDKT